MSMEQQNERATPADDDGQIASAIAALTGQFAELTNRFDSLSARLSEADKPLPTAKSGTAEQLLIQLLSVSRETLAKVSDPPAASSDVIEPLLRDLAGLVFNFDTLLEAQPNSTLEALRGSVSDIAERYGLQFYAPQPGDAFVPSLANAVETLRVSDKDEAGKVTRIVRVGCRYQDKSLYYPQVCVSRFAPDPNAI